MLSSVCGYCWPWEAGGCKEGGVGRYRSTLRKWLHILSFVCIFLDAGIAGEIHEVLKHKNKKHFEVGMDTNLTFW